MALADNIVINVRERPLSTDLNNLQSIIDRTLMDLMRYGQSSRLAGVPLESVRSCVPGGLIASPNGSNVDVSAGVLLLESATLLPVPGVLDSSYRIGISRVVTTVAMPVPGITTYYLIEASISAVTTVTASRDVLDPGTGNFVPTIVPKQVEYQVVFQLLTGSGGQAPTPTGGDWLPIAIVRRPGGGGAVAASDIIDVRPLSDAGRERPIAPARLRDSVVTDVSSAANTAVIASAYDGAGGLRSFGSSVAVDLSSATYLSPTTVIAASTKYYLYLAPWSAQELNPRFSDLATIVYEGVLVLSDVAPSASTLQNSAPVNLPAPFGISAVATNSAYYIGTVWRNGLNTGWVGMTRTDGDTLYVGNTSFGGTVFSPPVVGDNACTFSGVPVTAKILHMYMRWFGGAGATSYLTAAFQPTATVLSLKSITVDDDRRTDFFVDIVHDGSAALDLNCSLAPNALTSVTVNVVGWKE